MRCKRIDCVILLTKRDWELVKSICICTMMPDFPRGVKRPSTRPCELQRDILGDMIRSGASMNNIEEKANEYLDRKKIVS